MGLADDLDYRFGPVGRVRRGVQAVVARVVTGDGEAAVLAQAERLYVGYRRYQARITGRRLRVFVLERAPERQPSDPGRVPWT
jgi:hypothetical protein